MGAINRARKLGAGLYCGRVCAGIARRKNKTSAQKKAEKRDYDAAYRAENLDLLRAKKALYHQATYDPEQARIARAVRMPRHVEYCRQPAYRQYKSGYDRQRRAAEYGPFAEAYLLLLDVEREVKSRATNYEIDCQNDTLNKSLKRKRAYAQTVNDTSRQQQCAYGHEPEIRAVGNAQRRQVG